MNDFVVSNFKVYARANEDDQVTSVFSTCFEQPLENDVFIKEGAGDSFVHVSYYNLFDSNKCHNYKIVNGEMVETTAEEKEAEKANFPVIVSVEDKISRLMEENEALKEQMILLEECIMELSM